VIDLASLPCRLAAIALVLAAGGAAAQDRALSKDPIRFGVGIDAAYSTVFVAQHEKLFDKAGLTVEVVQYTSGGDGIDALVAGQIPMVAAAEPAILVRSLRTDMRVFAVMGQSGTYIKLAVRSSIDDVKQIKKFGIVPGSVGEFSTAKLMAKHGIEPSAIEMVRSGPPEFPALLSRGDVDAFFLWEPWPANAVKLGGKVLLTSGDVGYAYNMWVAAAGPWFDSHKPEAKAFLDLLASACAAVTADPNKAAVANQAVAKIPQATTLGLLKEVDCRVRDFTPSDLAVYREIADFLVSRKITPTKADVDKVVQVGFYKQ
jgi:NitT/TauT family transport system substrate-binding protein